MPLHTRRLIATLALLLGATSLGWLGLSAQATYAGQHLSGRESRAVSSAAPAALATTITVNSTADGTLAVLAANNRVPRTLAASSIPARADDNDTLLIVNRFGGNLAVGAATLSNLFGIFFRRQLVSPSFFFYLPQHLIVRCWVMRPFSSKG